MEDIRREAGVGAESGGEETEAMAKGEEDGEIDTEGREEESEDNKLEEEDIAGVKDKCAAVSDELVVEGFKAEEEPGEETEARGLMEEADALEYKLDEIRAGNAEAERPPGESEGALEFGLGRK